MSGKATPVEAVRRLHRRGVLQSVRDSGRRPGAERARGLALSGTRMTKVVAQLREEGVVGEVAAEGAGQRVGRPSTAVSIRPGAAFVVGAQVGAGTVQIGI